MLAGRCPPSSSCLFHAQSLYPETVQTGLLFETHPDLTPEIPPTWCEGSEVFHTTEKCTRLQAIQRNKRITGKPGIAMRQCFNCEDIIRAKRLG
jgi:hypothetical protein